MGELVPAGQERNLPATTNPYGGLGSTDVGAADIEMPRLKLLQALSGAVIDEKARQGDFFNSLTEESYGREILFVPAVGFKNRVLIRVGQGLQCRSLDTRTGVGDPGGSCASCSLKDWPDDRRKRGEEVPMSVSGPECRMSHNWVGLVIAAADPALKKGDKAVAKALEEPQMVVLQLSSIASKAARKINGLHLQRMMANPKAAWYDSVYRISSKQETNQKGTFFLPEVAPAGKASDEQKDSARALLQFLSGKSLEFEPQEEDIADSAHVSAANATAARTADDPDF